MADLLPPVNGPTLPTAPPPAVALKAGYKTTEFWLTVLAMLVGAVMASGLLPGGAPTQIAGIVASGLGSLGYTVSRTSAKNAAGSAVVLVLLWSVAARACGTPRR